MKRNLIVMLSVIFCLMVIGCPTEEKGEDDPSKGKTVEEQYRGVYKHSSDQRPTYEVTTNQFVCYHVYPTEEGYRWSAWTEDNDLYVYGRSSEFNSQGSRDLTVFKLGYFETNKLVISYGTDNDMKGDYPKQ